MPMRMIQGRTEILTHITGGKSDRWIARETHHGRDLIRQVRHGLNSPSNLFILQHPLGASRKVTPEVISEVERLTCQDSHLECVHLARILDESADFPNVGKSTVHQIRHGLHFSFTPPVITFPLTADQKAARYAFGLHHLPHGTDWSRLVFTDESCFIFNRGSWVWRRHGEISDEILHIKPKFPMKVMVFAGISHEFKSSLVAVEPGSIDAIAYVDDFVDGSGIIPNMNGRYGMKQWTYMQDGASVHRAESTMAYLTTMVNVLDGWPAGSPDLNPIENLWDVLKMRVEKEKPLTREGFIDVIMAAWDNLAMDLVNKLVASMPRRIRKLCEKQGGRLDY